MKRREFITLLCGAAAWPLAARAQQGERMRRIGVLEPIAAESPDGKARQGAFLQRLQQLGPPSEPLRYTTRRLHSPSSGTADHIGRVQVQSLAAC